MAKYRTNKAFYVEGRHYPASHHNPVTFEFPDDVTPSKSWEPLDAAAVAALKKAGVPEDKMPKLPAPPATPAEASKREAAPPSRVKVIDEKAEEKEHSGGFFKKGKRAADQEPV